MASGDSVVQRYATALHALAREAGIQEQVEAQLVDLDGVLRTSPELGRELANPRRPRGEKKHLLAAVLGERVMPLLRRTVLLMADKGRAGQVPDLPRVYHGVAMTAAGRALAHVASARPLDEPSRKRLREQLERLTGRSITLEEKVDEALLGGLRVIVGSTMIDGSLRRRLEMLKDNLLRVPLAGGGIRHGTTRT